ncbi:MAG: zinc-dependent metalloprotease [Xanthomonadales bacterium]|nr:zinc-dependent metalloprotease [Xanthomonadales bacterium]
MPTRTRRLAAPAAALCLSLAAPAGADTPETYRELLDGADTQRGLLSFHRSDDALHLELPRSLLDQPLGFAAVRVNGAGDFAPRGYGLDNQVVRFTRVGEHVVLVKENLFFRAEPGSDIAPAVEKTFGDSPVYSARVLDLDAPDALVIDAGDLFDTGLAQVVPDAVKREATDPIIESLKVFDDNVVARVRFTLRDDPQKRGESDLRTPWLTRQRLPDPRSEEAVVDFNFFRLPDDDYRPRPSDERIGGMTTEYKDYTSVDDEDTLFRHLLLRFDVRKADPDADISPPVEPITFVMDHSIPVQWRPLVREGTLWWNTAFEKVGIRDAVRVLDPPDDPDWDPATLGQSVIYWHLMDDLVFSGMAGPTLIDPRTGKVLKANVFLNGEFFSFALNRYLVYAWWRAPDPGAGAEWRETRDALLDARAHPFYCDRQASFSSQIAFARLVLQSRGQLEPGTPEADRFAREAFLELVSHEIGHALGFPHNWKASLEASWADVRDGRVSGEPGGTMFSSSVMDYDPIYFSPRGQPQGDYFMQGLGRYDDLYVEYIYAPFHQLTPAQERAELDRIAARAEFEPGLVHDSGMMNAIDPTANADDLGDDPLAFAEDRLTILREEVFPRLPELVLAEGHDYNLLRQALDAAIFSVALDYIDMSARHVGGQLTYKRVANSPAAPKGGPPPISPVPAATQRQALAVLDEHLFADDAFPVSPQWLALLKADMQYDWNYPWRFASDYDIGHRIAGLYEAALSTLLEPDRLARVRDNERRFADGDAFTMPELFASLRRSAFSAGEPDVDRRALQRVYVAQLIDLVDDPGRGTPPEASQLAAFTLAEIREDARSRQSARGASTYTRAHFADLERRITATLDAKRG